MEKVDEDASLEFKWLKKRGVGGKNKEVQFYESFIYDGMEYMLYDCVYMYKEGLREPYIGKLIKIWERSDKTKKVKIHWFFRPEEISKWIKKTKTLDNEILLASGEGHGLANINPLEAIAGLCNVVCISKDSRNTQPSDEELEAADFIFYRTFDVQSCTILDKMDGEVGGLEIKYVFNRKDGESIGPFPESTSSEAQQLLTTTVPNKLNDDAKRESQGKDIPNLLKRNTSPTRSDKLQDYPLKKLKSDDKKPPEEKRIELVNLVVHDDKLPNKTPTGSDKLHDYPLKKIKSDDKKPLIEKHVEHEVARDSEKFKDTSSKKLTVDNKSKNEENMESSGTSGTTENRKNGKILAKATDDSESKVIKRKRDDCSFKKPENMKLTMNKSFKVSDRDKKNAYQEFVCGPKPNADKSGWFRRLPWEERLKNAYDQGTAILLHNVDSDYTSGEVEDIIWHAFTENCEAKIIQRNAVSSPHYAQAFILLKTKEAAQRVLMELDEGCLMLSNGRPLVGTPCPPVTTKKNSNFFGHLVVDKIRIQNQRDMDEAVSTSHFSQPNTIEYDMAMEWCVLQSRSTKWWDKFHKLQGLELKKLETGLLKK